MIYLWLKAFHLIFVIAWFAGLFYVFRLFVYHVKFKDKPDCVEGYRIMESKLLDFIMKPSAILTLATGIALVWMQPAFLKQGWLHAKLLFVVSLILYHLLAEVTRRRFAQNDYFLSEKACRFINEIPAVALLVIVPLVILKPF